ncbi:MAG: organomercurial lyase [Terriglobales bacterium]
MDNSSPLLNSIKDALVRSASPQALPHVLVPMAATLMRMLAEGQPVSPQVAATRLRIGSEDAAYLFRKFQSMGMAELTRAGDLAGMVLSLNPTRHKFRLNGRTLYAWCAIDTLFLAPILQREAEVESTCPVTGAAIRLLVTPTEVQKLDPADVFLSLVAPGVTAGIVAECGPGLSGPEGAFCTDVHFLASRDAAQQWSARRSGSLVLPVDEAFDVAYEIWARPFLASLPQSRTVRTVHNLER